MHVVSGAAKALSVAISTCGAVYVLAQSASQAQPVLKSVQERAARYATSAVGGDNTKQGQFALCLESWDAATHMTKQNWRSACQRSVKDYPDAFR
jgi:hypothetical protein